MSYADLESMANRAVESVFLFSEFTQKAEHLFEHCQDKVNLSRYRDAWFELEIVNALALDDWDSSGRPSVWEQSWSERYKRDAMEVTALLLSAAKEIALERKQ